MKNWLLYAVSALCISAVSGCGDGKSGNSSSDNPAVTPDLYLAGYSGFNWSWSTIAVRSGIKSVIAGRNDGFESAGLALSGSDVYICGSRGNYPGGSLAVYYKNGSAVVLTDGSNPAGIEAICVSGSDVYAAGFEYIGDMCSAAYWKNGVPVRLTDGTKWAFCTDISVSGSDVYAITVEYSDNSSHTVGRLWKNGICVFSTPEDGRNFFIGMSVCDGDVYIAGNRTTVDGTFFLIWKNGEASEVSSDAPYYITDIEVSAGDVYVSGSRGKYAAVWKNGIMTALTDGKKMATAYAVCLSGSEVHVVGHEYLDDGTVDLIHWKNGQKTELLRNAAGFRNCRAAASGTGLCISYTETVLKSSPLYCVNGERVSLEHEGDSRISAVCRSGDDIAAAGYDNNGEHDVAVCWLNGTKQTLSAGSHDARATGAASYGGHLYISGYENNGTVDVAVCWKDGKAEVLSDGTADARALGIAASEAGVIACGWEKAEGAQRAACWIDGEKSDLQYSHDGTVAVCAAIDGNDMYAAGQLSDDTGVCWKNGVVLDMCTGGYTSIAVDADGRYLGGWTLIDGERTGVVWKNGSVELTGGREFGAQVNAVALFGGKLYAAWQTLGWLMPTSVYFPTTNCSAGGEPYQSFYRQSGDCILAVLPAAGK